MAGAERLESADPDPESAEALAVELLHLHSDRVRSAHRHQHLAGRFVAAHPKVPVASVAALSQDVHDLDGLREVAELLATNSLHPPA